MTKISFYCDRCKQPVEGLHTSGGTGGFYVVDGSWSEFGLEGEHFVCDECVQSMPLYQERYGPLPPKHLVVDVTRDA